MASIAQSSHAERPHNLTTLYDRDRYTWAIQQAAALKRRDFDAVDWDNVTGEIEALVTQQESSLKSQYARIIEHFLKLRYRTDQEAGNIAGWTISIDDARNQINDLLEEYPGLSPKQEHLFNQAWPRARRKTIDAFIPPPPRSLTDPTTVLREKKRLTREWDRFLPQNNPFSRRQAEDRYWLPERHASPQRPQNRRRSDSLDWTG